MSSILEKAQQDQAKETLLILEAAVKGLSPESPERESAFKKTLDSIISTISKDDNTNTAWNFTSEKTHTLFARDTTTILRPVQTTDADFYLNVKAQYSIMYRSMIHMGKIDNVSLLITDLFKPESFYCVIETVKDSTSIGYIGIKDTRADIWEIAIELDEKFTHKGYGLHSIQLFLNEMYRITGKELYRALVETDNLPSQKCFEKLGAKLIGLCNSPILKSEDEKKRFEDNNLNLIDDNIKALATRLEVDPRKLLSHILEYHIKCPL